MFEKLRQLKRSHSDLFYAVVADEVDQAERRLDLVFPDSMKALWHEFGYFFVQHSLDGGKRSNQTNRYLSPNEIEHLLSDDNETSFSSPEEERVGNAIPFFAASPAACLQTKLDDSGVFYFSEKVADDIEAFFSQLASDPDFYRD